MNKKKTAWGFDPGIDRDVGVLWLHEVSKTLTNGTCPGYHNGVIVTYDLDNNNEHISSSNE